MKTRIKGVLEENGICCYCGEPFKECDTIIPGVGVIVGETDMKKYQNNFWHRGCIYDFNKEKNAICND